MELDRYTDRGGDIRKGDFVFIKFEVLEDPKPTGDCRLRYCARNGKDEYAASSVNAVFIKRPTSALMKRLLNWFVSDRRATK